MKVFAVTIYGDLEVMVPSSTTSYARIKIKMADSGDESHVATSSNTSSVSMKKHRYDVKFKLEAVLFAENYSGEKAAKQFGVDSRRIREWKKQKADLLAMSEEDSKRARMSGSTVIY